MKTLAATAAFFDKPLALRRSVANALVGSVNALSLTIDDDDDLPEYGLDQDNGIAIIPIQGVLSKTFDWWCSGTSYDWIREGFDTALADPSIAAIVLDINSPGGSVEGCADLADHIYASRGVKPIWAILGESAYSAAYWLASSANRVTVPRTGGAGSIGVVCCHVDVSKMLKNAGIEVTYIQYGERKTDGAAEKPLSEDAEKRFQTDIDTLGELFVNTVARNRSLDAAAVKAMEAGCFLGPMAVTNGLCDEILAPDAAFQALLSKLA